jgi:hypothetical protein
LAIKGIHYHRVAQNLSEEVDIRVMDIRSLQVDGLIRYLRVSVTMVYCYSCISYLMSKAKKTNNSKEISRLGINAAKIFNEASNDIATTGISAVETSTKTSASRQRR